MSEINILNIIFLFLFKSNCTQTAFIDLHFCCQQLTKLCKKFFSPQICGRPLEDEVEASFTSQCSSVSLLLEETAHRYKPADWFVNYITIAFLVFLQRQTRSLMSCLTKHKSRRSIIPKFNYSGK